MKILFIYRGSENLGIEHISSLLKSKGHEVSLLFDPAVFSGDFLFSNRFLGKMFNMDKEIIRRAVQLKPDIVAFSAYTNNYQWCLNIARNIRKLSNVPIVFGGIHTTAVPERVLSNDFIDFAIAGEGEFPMLDLVKHLEEGAIHEELLNIPNLCFRYEGNFHLGEPRPYIKDLDLLPFPDKFLFYDKVPALEENYLIMAARGCPYSCTYCGNNMYHKFYHKERQHIRQRSADNVIEELSYIKKRRKTRLVVFVDDVFTSSKDWLEGFIEKYKSKINLPFFCSVNPLTITKEIAFLLKEGGCWLATMGIQSGSERIRREVFHRMGNNEKIIEAVSYIKSMGIKMSIDNIFGAPSETKDDLEQSLDLYKKLKTDRILTLWLTYYPKTDIIDYAKKEKMISDKDIESVEEGYTGLMHGTGSVTCDKIVSYAKYELLFQLRSLVHNDILYSQLSKLLIPLPFRKFISRIIIFLNAVKNKDRKLFGMIRYLVGRKNTP